VNCRYIGQSEPEKKGGGRYSKKEGKIELGEKERRAGGRTKREKG